MAYKIIPELCNACGACESECPNRAISHVDKLFTVDPNKCTECVGHYDEPQCQQVCPVDCIIPDPDHRETKEQLLEKYKRLTAAKAKA